MTFDGSPKFSFRRPNAWWQTAGLLAPAGLMMAIFLAPMVNCSPGKLDCSNVSGADGTDDYCNDKGGGGNGGDGGDGGGGNGGDGGGGGDLCTDHDKIRNAELDGCDIAGTVAEFEEDFVHPRCGKNSNCHNGTTFPPALRDSDDNLFTKLANIQPNASNSMCRGTGTYYINVDDPMKSFIFTKVTQDEPMCPGDEDQTAGEPMPFGEDEDPLEDNERDCMEAYVKAVAEACKD